MSQLGQGDLFQQEPRRLSRVKWSLGILGVKANRDGGSKRYSIRSCKMTKPSQHGARWTPADDTALRQMAAHNKPTRLIARELERTPGAVYSRAQELDVSLKPTNQSPYGPRRGSR
jgi:hypothetical protein